MNSVSFKSIDRKLEAYATSSSHFATHAIAIGKLAMVHSLALRVGMAFFLVCTVASAQDPADGKDAGKSDDARAIEFFEKQVAPILKRHCYQCHSHEAGKAKGGLMLDSRHGWKKGGSEGAAIVPGKPGESLLMMAVR